MLYSFFPYCLGNDSDLYDLNIGVLLVIFLENPKNPLGCVNTILF